MASNKRDLMWLVSTQGRTEDEIVEECMRRFEEWRAQRGADGPRHGTPDGGTTTE